jgi:hypothetical protein
MGHIPFLSNPHRFWAGLQVIAMVAPATAISCSDCSGLDLANRGQMNGAPILPALTIGERQLGRISRYQKLTSWSDRLLLLRRILPAFAATGTLAFG